MNKPEEPKPISWRKFIWVGLILLIAGYSYGHPTLEKWTGLDLPSLNGDGEARRVKPEKGSNSAVETTESESFLLTETGRNKYTSPAGLIYTMGPNGEHRVEHIMRHAKDEPSRQVHGVFDGDKNTILKILDDGYELIKSNSKRVESSREGNRMEYTIDMQREIGYEGGQKGKRNNFPPLKRLKLILQDKNYVVTAYPYR